MSIQKYHVSKNLFDKNNYLEYNGYFNKLSGTTTIINESNNKIVYIPCKSNTTYTVSRIAGKRFAVGCSVDVPSNDVTVYDVNGSASGATSLTVTTTADAKYLVVYIRNGNISGESSLTDIIDSLQIEEGKAATPYEPYGNTWNSIPYREYHLNATSLTSDEITTDGSNLSGLQIDGNMIQEGVPLPTNIIYPMECGDKTAQMIPEIVQGWVDNSDGNFDENANRVRTNLIKVVKGHTYTIYAGNQYLATGCYYKNGVFVSSISNVVGSTKLGVFTVPDNANQVAISFRKLSGESIIPSELNDYMLSEAIMENDIFDYVYLSQGYSIGSSSGLPTGYNGRFATTTPIDVTGLQYLRLTFGGDYAESIRVITCIWTGDTFVRTTGIQNGATIDVTGADNLYLAFYLTGGDSLLIEDVPNIELKEVVLEPFVPYGYRIALKCNNTTNLLYLSNPLCKIDNYADTINANGTITRTINKYEFTGQETGWGKTSTGRMRCALPISPLKGGKICFCSHYTGTGKITISSIDNGDCTVSATAYDFVVYDANYTSYEDYAAWVAQQYDNGTPLTVWYIMATSITEQITLPTLPTTAGQNTFTVDATLAPSDVKLANWWENKGYGKGYGTGTEVITSFPAEIIGDGTNASLTIKGNLSQSGTPTAASPIYPSECGDKTENLFDLSAYYAKDNGISNIVTTQNSITYNASSAYLAIRYKFPLAQNETMKISLGSTTGRLEIRYYNTQTEQQVGDTLTMLQNERRTLTGSSEYDSVRIYLSNGTTTGTMNFSDIMINLGTTFLPFEPYGYKIPVSLSQTPIYITDVIRKIDGITTPIERTTGGADEISSNGTLTRKITKMELDGTESDWRKGGGEGNMAFFVNSNLLNGAAGSPILCSHFPVSNDGSTTTDIGIFIGSTGSNLRIRPENVTSMELTDWTTWLSNQKAAGTPVTIYYVAATPITEQVTVPTLPTTGTPEQFNVDTTLKPSEVQLTYHGWHNHNDTEFSE